MWLQAAFQSDRTAAMSASEISPSIGRRLAPILGDWRSQPVSSRQMAAATDSRSISHLV
jgi:hypothetical protein